jgi:hypothetical protein
MKSELFLKSATHRGHLPMEDFLSADGSFFNKELITKHLIRRYAPPSPQVNDY